MCRLEILYYHNGYVVRCSDCRKLQIGYGTLLLTFGEEAFGVFRQGLQRLAEQRLPGHIPFTRKSLTIPTPCEGLQLLLSLRELAEFNAMLEEADTELQTQALLQLFET